MEGVLRRPWWVGGMLLFCFVVLLHTEDDTAPICFFLGCRCTAVRTAALLYVVKVWSVGGWRVHCVVRGGWVGRPVRGSLFSSCGR